MIKKYIFAIFIIFVLITFTIISDAAAQTKPNSIEIQGYFNIGEKRFADGTFSYEYFLFKDIGNDTTLDGGAGNDHIYGREGDDSMFGRLGDDVCIGGSGTDTADIACEIAVT